MCADAVVIHGHFYQPPREHPWTGRIERQASAAPAHDWNERIHAECYRANAFARVHGADSRIVRLVNNYAWISFDFGPTLLSWIQRHDRDTYARILAADRDSLERVGSGNALAQAYNHMILPLANERDKRTQVRWGVADFVHRFGRRPEGMWLPETAADDATLQVLAEEGLRFTILAPAQAAAPVTPDRAYRWSGAGGASLALFFYDGPISHDISFGELLKDGRAFAGRLLSAPGPFVSIATDGETYGHHKKFGDLSLAYAVAEAFRPTNYAAWLAAHPPTQEVKIVSPSSWSCPHGVERWASDCGCRLNPAARTSQSWRAVLRAALNRLRDRLAALFEQEGERLLVDPWAARDEYVQVLLSRSASADFFKRRIRADRTRALELLEMQHQAMLMFTSCGWFFDDIGGIESQQVLRHAARAVELSRRPLLGERLARDLEAAKSNRRRFGDGTRIYREAVSPDRIEPERAVAHAVLGSRRRAPAYRVRARAGKATWTSSITGESRTFAYQRRALSCVVGDRRYELGDLLPEDREAILMRRLRPLLEEARRAGIGVTTEAPPPPGPRLLPQLRRWLRQPDAERFSFIRELLQASPVDLWEAQNLAYEWLTNEVPEHLKKEAAQLSHALGFAPRLE
jgi:alpha-amylase/alpha-mannosidase (GH57 family)